MKAEETRKKLVDELNNQLNIVNGTLREQESHVGVSMDKPKMFEPKRQCSDSSVNDMFTEQSIKGMGFSTSNVSMDYSSSKQQEIYNMKEFIKSEPEYMQTIPYDTKVVKQQMALIKRRDWQDFWFKDIDWFKPIDVTFGFKKLFKF